MGQRARGCPTVDERGTQWLARGGIDDSARVSPLDANKGAGMRVRDNGTSSRRDLLSFGAAAGVMGLMSAPETAYGAGHDNDAVHCSLNVRTFGAVGDAATDDTAAFQHALDAVYKSGGGVV